MKAPNLNETTMQLLMNPADQRDITQHVSDPVEMRRLNYQTPGKKFLPPLSFRVSFRFTLHPTDFYFVRSQVELTLQNLNDDRNDEPSSHRCA